MDDIYKFVEEYYPGKEQKLFVVFDDMIADMFSNKMLDPVLTELFIRGRKMNMSVIFITQSYFHVPKNIGKIIIMKIQTKRELQQVAFNHSLEISYKDFMNLYKKRTAKPCIFSI